MEGVPEDMWSPYKQIYNVFQNALTNPNGCTMNLDICLKKYKQNFANFLRNPPKNEKSRSQLLNSLHEGVPLIGHPGRKLSISKDIIDEAIIISDMFDLNEMIALEMLCTAQRQTVHHPGLPRGLVAVLLYYDGRKAITFALRDIFQATTGVSWATELPRDITNIISTYAQSIVDDGNILLRIIELLDTQLDINRETAMLTKNRAFGSIKHQNQVLGLFEDIRMGLAMALFNWSAQRSLPKPVVVRLIHCLLKYKGFDASGNFDDVFLTLLMALLYSFDTSVLQRQEDNNEFVQRLPILNDEDFTQHIFDTLSISLTTDPSNRLDSIIKFAFGLSLSSLRHAPSNLHNAVSAVVDHDEQLIDEAIRGRVFEYLYHTVLENELVYKTEFFFRRMHNIFTDFIDYMHSKVTELRGRADETSRTVISFIKEGLEPPQNLDNNFEMLLLCIGKLYKNNRTGLTLCEDYWGPYELTGNVNYSKATTRSVSLFKFIRLAGELLPSTLFVAYLHMIAGLTTCERSARNAFNLLKQVPGVPSTNTLSWDHFFNSIKRYYTDLRQESYPGIDTIYRNRAFNRSINPQEIEGLHAVFEIITAVTAHDEISRIMICQHPTWTPPQLLFGLLSCSVPISLKAEILHSLASLGKSTETCLVIWTCLEDSQVIPTIPSTTTYSLCSFEDEIEQNESRAETYALSRAILDLLYTLMSTNMPSNLGSGPRKPGYDPYLTFIVNSIFLKFYNRTYKNPVEKWEIGAKCLKILFFLIETYLPKPQDFGEQREHNAPPGYHIMLQLQVKSDTLRLLLLLIEDVRTKLDDYTKFRGKEQLEECALYCLSILENALVKQNAFFEAHAIANSSVLLSGLNRVLLDVNPRTRQPDYLMNTTKFVTYNSWLPNHTLMAVKILCAVTRLPGVAEQLLTMFLQNDHIRLEIRQGFVECLELDIPPQNDEDESLLNTDSEPTEDELLIQMQKIELQIKEAIIELFQHCITQTIPNFIYFLLGFETHRDFTVSEKQKQLVIELGSNCTKSLVSLLERHLELKRQTDIYDEQAEHIVERVWDLFYNLCSNRRTTETLLRYFRLNNDFLLRHIVALPYKHVEQSHVLNQMCHLLKCTAIELKLMASNGQISRFHHLCGLLVGTAEKQRKSNMPMEYSNFIMQSSSLFADTSINMKSSEGITGQHICSLLDHITLSVQNTPIPKYEFFDAALTTQILGNCECPASDSTPSFKLINIKRLHDIMHEELVTVQSTIASGQRQLILLEIRNVLLYGIQNNVERRKRFATVKFIQAWSQVVQTLFSCVPESALPLNLRKQHIIDIIQKILAKVVPIQPLLEISIMCTDTVLLLLALLRYTYYQLEDSTTADSDQDKPTNDDTTDTIVNNTTKANTQSLRYILKNILEWIMVSEVTSQKLRINLYTALLNCLRILKRFRSEEQIEYNEAYVSLLDKSKTQENVHYTDIHQIRMAIEVITSFGDKLIDVFCHDAITGHDVCRMLALSCLDMLMELDSQSAVINYVSTRGYLSHLLQSLLNSDDSLCDILQESPDNLKALYVYESKMSFLLRLSSCYRGAELLLTEHMLGVLANMKVFDLQPDLKAHALLRKEPYDAFLPSIDERFRSILFPALNVCDCLLTTLSSENCSVSAQVLNFLFAHGDMLETVLRTGTPYMDLGFLKELSAITNIIARATIQDLLSIATEDTNNDIELKNRYNRVQQLMMTLYARFIVSEKTLSNILKPENVSYELSENNKSLHRKYFLEISANLSLYCRNTITNHAAEKRGTKYLLTTICSNVIPLSDGKHNDNKKLTFVLTTIINQLKGSVEYSLAQKSVVDNLLQQRTSLSNISFDPSAKTRYMELTQRYNNKRSDLSLSVFITEHSVYLLWVHLDYYLRRAAIYNYENKNSINDAHSESSFGLTASYDEILSLKKTLVSIFNETFCTQLLATSALATKGKEFTEALLRRIKALIQFVPNI